LVQGTGRTKDRRRNEDPAQKKREETNRIYLKIDTLLHPEQNTNENPNDLPDIISMTEDEVTSIWGYWLLYRATGCRIDFANAAFNVPGWIVTGILELENIVSKMEQQDRKRKAGTANA
jgi:hypothetical protein